jgi:uncharacterized protein (TIGR02271 family)
MVTINSFDASADTTGENNPIHTDEKFVIPIIQEQLQVSKEILETGKISISKKVIEENYDTEVSVYHEDVIVERKPIDKYIEGDLPQIRIEGDTTIMPIIKEVIIKRLLLVEEVHITMRKTETVVPVHEVLRKEEITIIRNDSPLGAD